MKNSIIPIGLLMGIASVLVPSSAHAFTFVSTAGPCGASGCTTSVAGTTTIDFDDGSTSNGFATYNPTAGAVVLGSIDGLWRTPLDDETPYLSVGPSTQTGDANGVTITLANLADYFGLYWGSIDTYNSIIFKNGDTTIASYTGGTPGITPADGLSSSYVDFFAQNPTEFFNKVILTSVDINAFESDNHAYREAVPEPITILGTLTALGAGYVMKRKQRASA